MLDSFHQERKLVGLTSNNENCSIHESSTETKYSYDSFNRLYQVSYNVGTSGVPATPTVTYTYGTSAQTFNNGRLLSMTDGVGSETYTYNNMGEVTGVTKVIDGTTYHITRQPNPDGTLASLTYPQPGGGSGRVVTQAYDAVGRLQQVSSSGTTFLTVGSGDYNAAGQLKHFTYGNGVEGDFTYNERLQIETIRYHNDSPDDLLNLAYSYTTGPGATDNNGQIRSITYFTSPGVEDTAKSQTFEYDAWMRLSRAYTTNLSASVPGTWRLEWTYDRFGNRLTQTGTVGSASVTQPQLTVSETTNCITSVGFVCDASGNLVRDTSHTYSYDAENRLVKVDGGTTVNVYDGNGLRVMRTVGSNKTTYIFSGTKVIEEFTGTQTKTLNREYVYAGSKLLASISGNVVTYVHQDHLSTRVETDSIGRPTRTYGHLPFGEKWYETGTASKWKFTTYEREDETTPDYAMFRHYSSNWGRFMQADPLAGEIRVPASLNRYAYVLGDPINLFDPLGLRCQWIVGELDNTIHCWDDDAASPGGGPSPEPDQIAGTDSGGGGGEPGGRGGGGDGGPATVQELASRRVFNPDCLEFILKMLEYAKTTILGRTSGWDENIRAKVNGINLTNFVDSLYNMRVEMAGPNEYDPTALLHVPQNSNRVFVDGPRIYQPVQLIHENFHRLSVTDLSDIEAAGGATGTYYQNNLQGRNAASAAFEKELEKHCK